jgi:hypothetical protein
MIKKKIAAAISTPDELPSLLFYISLIPLLSPERWMLPPVYMQENGFREAA